MTLPCPKCDQSEPYILRTEEESWRKVFLFCFECNFFVCEETLRKALRVWNEYDLNETDSDETE